MSASTPRFFTTSILPVRQRLVLKAGMRTRVPLRVRVGYFHHPKFGHTLIDTGYSRHVTDPSKGDFSLALYRQILKPQILSDDPLAIGLAQLGIVKSGIETVIITHFHADHIGGLLDLPGARILCPRKAWDSFQKQGKIANALQGVFAGLMPDDFEDRVTFLEDAPITDAPYGLDDSFDIAGDGTILSVDLPGHLNGHVGLCFPKFVRPFLYATDTQWVVQAIMENRCPGFPANRMYHHSGAAMQSVQKVQEFATQGGEVMLCHDPHLHPLDIDGDFTI